MLTAIPLLVVAVAVEVGATAALPRARGFTDPLWTAAVLGGYAVAIWLLSIIVKHMDVSVAYAVWAGMGTAAIAVFGAIWLGERLDVVKVAALAMIIVGVVVLNLRGGHAASDGSAGKPRSSVASSSR